MPRIQRDCHYYQYSNNREYSRRMWMIILAIVTLAIGNFWGGQFIADARAQNLAANFSLKTCLADTQACAKLCVKDAKLCAATFNRDLHAINFEDDPGWHRFPLVNKGGPRFNSTTPMHGNLVEVFLNKPAFDRINLFIEDTKRGELSLLDRLYLPDGAIIFKRNYVNGPDANAQNWPTVMIKLKGYCKADEFRLLGQCAGGNWFWFLYRGALFDFDGMAAFGKPQSFCLGCHNPVQRSDYSFLLDALRLELGPKTIARNVPSQAPAQPDFCNDASLSPKLPGDVGINPAKLPPAHAQAMFDCLSWRSFVALNWPVAVKDGEVMRGVADDNTRIGTQLERPRVWETYAEVYEAFQPRDQQWTLDNRNFDDPQTPPTACGAVNGYRKTLRMNSKFRGSIQVLNESHQAFGNQFNTLVDQQRQTLRYEVRMNRGEYDYLKRYKLANTGNYGAGGPFDFSSGGYADKYFDVKFPAGQHSSKQKGAMEIKGAWRILCKPDASRPGGLDCFAPPGISDQNHLISLKKRYLTSTGDYFEETPQGDKCTNGFVFGLVGLHVAHKTFWAPQWVWSTFEHIDNVPPADSKGDGRNYTLFSPDAAKHEPAPSLCVTQRPGVFPPGEKKLPSQCRDRLGADGIHPINNGKFCSNLQLILNAKPHPACAPANSNAANQSAAPIAPSLVPNQVTRIDRIGLGGTAVKLNKLFRAKLAGTPFENYVLVNTQWPVGANVPGDPSQVYTRPCTPSHKVTKDCFTIVPINPATGLSVRLRNTTMETFQVTFNPLDGDNDRSRQKSSVGCMQCHNQTGVDASYLWVDAAEEVVPIAQ